MNFKVGDKVRVRRDLQLGRYGKDSVVRAMLGLAGQVVTIRKVVGEIYRIEEDSDWGWTDEMFYKTAVKSETVKIDDDLNNVGEHEMTSEEYETAIGKLVILKLFLTEPHKSSIDEVIEGLETEYLSRKGDI